jgi:gliding motility-associated-like protein
MKRLLFILFLVPFLFYAQDTTTVEVCTHDQTHLQTYSVTNGPNQYSWSVVGGFIESGNGTSSIVVNWLNVPYSMYLVQVSVVSNAGCPGNTVQLWVDIDECSYDGIYVPNSFTPQNPDGVNDVFKAVGSNIERMKMYIFNRWGEPIHEIHDINGSWDGTYLGEPCQEGVYVWFLEYKFEGNEFDEELRGHVVLIR